MSSSFCWTVSRLNVLRQREKERKSYLSCRESGVEGHNGEHIDEEDDHARDGDRAGKIPHRVLGRSLE